MRKELIICFCALAFLTMLLIALFTNRDVQDSTENTLHEITTFDLWKQTAYTPAAYCPLPQAGQGYYPAQGATIQQAAMAGAPAILEGQEKPVLIKQMGAEVIPVGGGKVKITGVMGKSWADKAGLRAGDILLNFNTRDITGLAQFQSLVTKAPPEKEYKIKFMRGSKKKKALLTIGEGEMEGFTPIQPLK